MELQTSLAELRSITWVSWLPEPRLEAAALIFSTSWVTLVWAVSPALISSSLVSVEETSRAWTSLTRTWASCRMSSLCSVKFSLSSSLSSVPALANMMVVSRLLTTPLREAARSSRA